MKKKIEKQQEIQHKPCNYTYLSDLKIFRYHQDIFQSQYEIIDQIFLS